MFLLLVIVWFIFNSSSFSYCSLAIFSARTVKATSVAAAAPVWDHWLLAIAAKNQTWTFRFLPWFFRCIMKLNIEIKYNKNKYNKSRMQKAKCRMQKAECRMQKAECRMRNSRKQNGCIKKSQKHSALWFWFSGALWN